MANRFAMVKRHLISRVILALLWLPLLVWSGELSDTASIDAVSRRAQGDMLVVEGMIISQSTGEYPTDGGVVLSVDSKEVPVDEQGMFRTSISRHEYFTLEVSSSGFESFREIIQTVDGQRNYFVTCALKPREETDSQSKPSAQKSSQPRKSTDSADMLERIPWTISGTIIDSRVDLAVESDSTVLTFDGEEVSGTDKGNFYITTNIGGRHVLSFSSPGYNDVIREIDLTGDQKQPFVVIATSAKGHEITRREIVVSAKSQSLHRTARIAKTTVSRKEIQRTAATFSDPMRVLQTLPGVTSTSDISSRPVVRGGEIHQSRVYLDGISLIQPYHYGGLHSTFNQLAIDNISLYSSGFPSHLGNSLSALIEASGRRPAQESFELALDCNLLQSAAYIGVPLFDNKAGINLAWQGSYYQHVANLMMGVFADDETKEDFKHITLPDYNDISVGFELRPNSKWSFSLTESFNGDKYMYTESDSGIPVQAFKSYDNGPPVVHKDTLEDWELDDFRWNIMPNVDSAVIGDKSHFLDTVFIYKSNYNILGANATFTPNDVWVLKTSLAWQKRWWDIDFPVAYSEYIRSSKFDVSINQGNGGVGVVYSGIKNHLIRAGLQIDATRARYNVYIPRFLHEMITKGSTTLYDFLGPMTGDTGTVLTHTEMSDYLFDLSERLLINYRGDRDYVNAGVYVNDSWEVTDKVNADVGVRLETCTADSSVTLSPRFTLKYKMRDNLEMLLSAGRYTQNNYEPAVIALSRNLGPEKTWHADAGAQSRLLPSLSVKSNLYYKSYSGLLSEVIESQGRKMPPLHELIYHLRYRYSPRHLQNLTQDELAQLAYEFFSESSLYTSYYTNKGSGYAYGWENMVRYEVGDFWHGWLSFTLGRSVRQRLPGWRKHPFPLETPLLISFVNYYRLPRRYEFSVKYRLIGGRPYTPTDASLEEVRISDFNSGRLAPYQSLDFRISKGFLRKRMRGHLYIEVWNSLNSPNLFMLDSKTKHLQGQTTNIPVPVLLFGFDFDLL